MSNPKDGGPAFANLAIDPSGDIIGNDGMSLRDYFAGQALAGFCSREAMHANPGYMAMEAYKHADAMLKARGEEK